MAAVHNFEELVTFLNENKVQFRHDSAQQVIELPSQSPPLVGNLYMRWEKSVPFIQVIQFMVENVPADRVREVETAIARLNNTLEVGGFGIDHAQRRLYCRMTVPCFQPDGINPIAINQLGNGIVRNALEFLDVFQAIIGGKPGDQVVEIYKEISAKRAGGPPPPAS